MITLTKKEYKSLPSLKDNDYIKIHKNELYKTFRFLVESDINFLIYLCNLDKIDGLILPNDLISIENKIVGYSMDYLKNTLTIQKYITSLGDKNKFDILTIIESLFTALNKAHHHFIIADIHNQNILVNKNKGFFIDLDNGTKNISKYSSVKYNIYDNDEIVTESILTDNIKTFIVSLSLYYKLNFEKIYENYGLNVIYDKLKESQANKAFIEYLSYLLDCINNNNLYNIESFNDYISYLNVPKGKERARFLKTF